MAAGFLAANGIVQAYEEPFGVGVGPRDADLEVASGVAFATAAAEAFQQPFLFERIAFLDSFPGSEAKSLGVEWGRAVGRHVVAMRVDDGSEPSEVKLLISTVTNNAQIVSSGFPPARSTGPGLALLSLPLIAVSIPATVKSSPGRWRAARNSAAPISTIPPVPSSPTSST